MRSFAGVALILIMAFSAHSGRSAEPVRGGMAKELNDVIYGRKSDLALTLDVFTPEKQNGAAVVHLVQQTGNDLSPGCRATALNGASCSRLTARPRPFNAVRGAVQVAI